MNQFSRDNHFVPSFYLVGFSDTSKRNGNVWQFDGVAGTVSAHRAKEIGKELDYHIVRIAGAPSDRVESLFARLETSAAPVIREIDSAKQLPKNPKELGDLMMFVAMSYIRGPRDREFNMNSLNKIETMKIRMVLMSADRWARYVDACQQNGLWYPQGSYEELSRRFRVEEESVQVANASELHTANVVAMVLDIDRLLQPRHWGIEFIDSGPDFFISSDSPATVAWIDRRDFSLGACGLAMTHSEVLFPLTKRITLVGRFEPMPRSRAVSGDRVASINGITAGFAHQFVYGPKDDFTALDNAGNQTDSSYWFACMKEPR